MGKTLLEEPRPAMWTAESVAGVGEIVRFGRHRIAVADVEDVRLEEIRDDNTSGLVLGSAAFLVASCAFTYFVAEQGAMLRFLNGAGFLAMLALAGLAEIRKLKTLKLYEMQIVLKGGENVRFTSVDPDDIQALALKLTAARGA